MPRISLLVGDEDLELIDAAATPNRSAFMIEAAKQAALRIQRAREDEEIARICAETAGRDADLIEEFAPAISDGL